MDHLSPAHQLVGMGCPVADLRLFFFGILCKITEQVPIPMVHLKWGVLERRTDRGGDGIEEKCEVGPAPVHSALTT